jgi:hypothetical protein
MCPACIGNAALIVTGAVSAGGWTAFALRKPQAPGGAAKPKPVSSSCEQQELDKEKAS